MGQLEWERAKAKLSYVVQPATMEEVRSEEPSKDQVAAAIKAALAKIDAKKVLLFCIFSLPVVDFFFHHACRWGR